MEQLVMKHNGQPVTNSLLVAEKFNKEHKNVLQTILNLTAENSAARFFFQTTYKNRGKKYPMYLMTRDGFSLLVMGFTGEQSLKFKIAFLEAFNKMEKLLQSDDYILLRSQDILKERIKAIESNYYQQQEQLEIKTKQLEALTPYAEYTKEVLLSEDTFTVTQIAKEFGYAAPTLNRILQKAGVQYKQNDQWLLKHKYQNKGYTKTNTYSQTINGNTKTYHTTVWTEKGRLFIHELIKSKSQYKS